MSETPLGARTSSSAVVENLQSPKISVVLPTHNRAKLLPSAIASVLNQTFKDFELLVVNDGSIDQTETVLKSYADPRLNLLSSSTPIGPAAARNLAIAKARGDFIAYLDDDNTWRPNFLSEMSKVLELDASVQAVLCGKTQIGIWSEGGQETIVSETIILPSRYTVDRVFHLLEPLDTNLIMHRRALLDEIGLWDSSLVLYEDADLIMRASLKYPNGISALAQDLVIYFDRKGETDNLTAKGGFAAAKKQLFEKFRDVPNLKGQTWYPDIDQCRVSPVYRKLAYEQARSKVKHYGN